MTPDANDLCVFAIKRGIIEGRIDPHFYLPEFQTIVERIKKQAFRTLDQIAAFSDETTDYSEFSEGTFDYLEISGVSLGLNTYQTTTVNVENAPSRAKMKTKKGDIVISTTRPHRGAIAEIKNDGIIASTGFCVIREIDEQVDRKWLIYALLSNCILMQMLQRSSGGNYPAIIEKELRQLALPIFSLSKQKSMVNKMERRLEKMNCLHRNSEQLLQANESYVSAQCGFATNKSKRICYAIRLEKLDGVIDAKRYMPTKSKNPLCISDLCEIVEEKTNVANYKGELVDWIRIDDLPNNPLDIEAVRTLPAEEMEGSFFEVRKDDILVARLGPTILNKKTVIVRDTNRVTLASAEFLVLRCKEGVNPDAVMAVLKTDYYRDLMYSFSRGSTPSRYRLNREDALKLPFPNIKDSQEKIAEKAIHIRNEARRMRDEATREWAEAKAQFEIELLGEA